MSRFANSWGPGVPHGGVQPRQKGEDQECNSWPSFRKQLAPELHSGAVALWAS